MKSNKPTQNAIVPSRAENFPEWYQQVIKAAELAEVSPVRGCMIIRPWGFAIWENMQRILNEKFKATGHQNLYFPLLIPVSFMQKEADHVSGFAKECAVVTHQRLEKNAEGKLAPASPLEEPYVIRPTSETIIGEAFARWIQSYRDLPLLTNQWANIVRWEMRTRLFLRTSEFLWQEGHTAHATAEEAMEEAMAMLDTYARFTEEHLAMPVIKGEKTPSERFPGADHTYCIEALMQDKKALQAGTSHFLGQHFSRGFNIKFLTIEGTEEFAWTTSWGVSTRLIGGLIMTHSDDNGLLLPPKVAPAQVVILPVVHKAEDRPIIMAYCHQLATALQDTVYHGQRLAVQVDKRDLSGGEKAWSWFKKGVPLRLEIGRKEVSGESVTVGRRDHAYHDRLLKARAEFLGTVTAELDDIQAHLLLRAQAFQKQHTATMTKLNDLYDFFKEEAGGGLALAHWNGDPAIEAKMKKDLGITIRCLPFEHSGPGACIFSGEHSPQQALFAKAY